MSAADQVPHDESSPLLENQVQEDDMKKATAAKVPTSDSDPVKGTPTQEASHVGYMCAADGVPMTAVGEPVGRTQWNSSLFTCLGRNDEFCSSDLEVCLLGTMAPCILYGSNAERLGSSSTTFASHCMAYCGLYLFGSSFLGFSLAPFFSYTTRTAIRRKFNLEGSYEAFHRSCGCCGSPVEDNLHREHCETACDMLTHVFCHTCALCQEGRELRRRLPHPGFGAHSVLVMIPPGEQTMNRTKA